MTHAIENFHGQSYLDFSKSWDNDRPRDRYKYRGRHTRRSDFFYKFFYITMCGLTGFLLASMLTY